MLINTKIFGLLQSSSHPSAQYICKIGFENLFWGQPVDSNDFNLCREAQLISNLHFHQACSINMRFVFFLPGIFIVRMYFPYLLVFLLEIY